MKRGKFIDRYTDFIRRAMALSEKSRREGLLSLECEVEDIDDEFFKEGLRLIIDAYDPSIVNEILSNKAAHEKDKYTRLLRAIQKRAVLAMQQGYSSMVFLRVLNSLAGVTSKEEYRIAELLQAAEDKRLEKYTAAMENDDDDELDDDQGPDDQPEIFRFRDVVILDSPSMQMVLRNVDTHDLAQALKKARNKVKRSFFGNISRRAGAMLREEMEYMGYVPEEQIKEAQEKIAGIIRGLAETGEIVIRRSGQ